MWCAEGGEGTQQGLKMRVLREETCKTVPELLPHVLYSPSIGQFIVAIQT